MIWNAAGTWDLLERPDFPYDVYVQKTVTVNPRTGNAWRWERWGGGIVNNVGVTNPGLVRFQESVLPALRETGIPLVVSVLGFDLRDWDRLAAIPTTLELNLSCPNLGEDIGADPSLATRIIRVVKRQCASFGVKLPPHSTADVARACDDAGADYLALTNSLSTPRGGLSGKPLQTFALELIERVRGVTSLPIVGMGGIESQADIDRFYEAGADDVAIGTGHLLRNFQSPIA